MIRVPEGSRLGGGGQAKGAQEPGKRKRTLVRYLLEYSRVSRVRVLRAI